MKIAYVSGLYRGASESDVAENIWHARQVAVQLWQMGYAVICPHCNTAFMGGVVPDSTFLQGDEQILARCDLVVMLPGWQKSPGATVEHYAAKKRSIPVFEWPQDSARLAEFAVEDAVDQPDGFAA